MLPPQDSIPPVGVTTQATRDLLEAYDATKYVAYAEGQAVGVRIGARSAALDAILRRHGAASGTFITAWNPRSRPADRTANEAAAARLAAAVGALGLAALPHRGVPDHPGWAAEEGLFVLGLAEADAVALAERFEQNAVVRIAPGEAARLLPTRWLGLPTSRS